MYEVYIIRFDSSMLYTSLLLHLR